MSDRLRYEEVDRQFNDLSVPDEEASWQKMRALLDKDEDDDRIIPPVLLRTCLGWGILLFLGLGIVWLIVRPERWLNEMGKTQQTSSTDKSSKSKENADVNKKSDSNQLTRGSATKNAIVSKQSEIRTLPQSAITYQRKKKISPVRIVGENKNYLSRNKKHVSPDEDGKPPIGINNNSAIKISIDKKFKQEDKDNEDTSVTMERCPRFNDISKEESIAQSKDSTNQKNVKPSQKKLFLTVGMGEQQQIPIAGQTAVPYSHYGRKGSLSDYVPSVYVQLQKEQKWFVQGEFRFGAAQVVKEFSYNRKTKYDTASMNLTTTTMRLKKTYYHQLPFSFNYYLKPNLSVGIGGIYSRFYGAITERETEIRNISTQTTTTLKQIIPIRRFTDSFLYKTQVHILVQANYQWRKFSVGLRYTNDIQPYIKYTKPDGTVNEEKNQSLEFVIRYRLWQSRKF
jgi:hypothetical protein